MVFGKTPLLKSNNFAREIIAALSSQDTPRGGIVYVSHIDRCFYTGYCGQCPVCREQFQVLSWHTPLIYIPSLVFIGCRPMPPAYTGVPSGTNYRNKN